jgi:hypothetical protein
LTSEQAREVLAVAAESAQAALGNFAIRGVNLADAEIFRFDLVAEMADAVIADVRRTASAMTEKQFLDYDPSYQTSNSQVLVEALDEIPELATVDGAIRVGDVPDDAGGSAVVAMAHLVGSGEDAIAAYRLKGPGIATRRARGIPLLPRDGVYRPVDEEVLFYEPRFDVLTCRGFAYFTTVTLIQTKLHADDKARELARETLATVTTGVAIDGYESLERAVMDDPTLRAKMASVARLVETDPEYASKLTTDRLLAFVESNQDYNIRVSLVDGHKALLFDASPQHRHQIPRLLADDYLHSLLTDRKYEAGSKQRVQA